MTTDQLNIAIEKFKNVIANGYETITSEPEFEITNDGIRLRYIGSYRIYTCWVSEDKESPIKDFKVTNDYDKMPFSPEDND